MPRAQINIDLGAIRSNTSILKQRAETTDFLAVLKADGYGHGAVEVANASIEGGATWLGVATIQEGMHLRGNGIEIPILLLSEPEANLEDVSNVISADLTPVVYTKEFISLFGERSSRAEVHLKIDTGMHRVGCHPEDAINIAAHINNQGLFLGGVMTHLSSAQTSVKETSNQVQRFDKVFSQIAKQTTLAHVLNTWGVLNFPNTKYDMVRCGIGMYGLVGHEFGLKPALSFNSYLSHIHWLPEGSGVGYAPQWVSQQTGYVGVVPVGYADGIPVLAAGRAWVKIGGRRYPIVSVTMDMLMVDLGRTVLETGTEVELISESVSVKDWQDWLNISSYEVLCGLGNRVRRNYERNVI